MPVGRWGVWFILLSLCAACASHGSVHNSPDESRPHISWEIRSGADGGDADFVCGSSQPGKARVIPASTDKTATLATLHLFAHAAAQPTSYLGFMRAPFLGGEVDRKSGEINATVAPGNRPVGTTVVDRVTSKPGEYLLSISIDATQPNAPNSVRISQEVPVVVK
jgi:hypothetical protein